MSFLSRLLGRNLTWEKVRRQPHMNLYAGHVPNLPEYAGKVGLSLTAADPRHLCHDMTTPLPLPDGSVDSFQSEDVFEHIEYGKLAGVIDEIFRALKPGACFRLSLPDYGCDVYRERSEFDTEGNLVFDPGGGGTRESPGHVWFPRIDSVRALLEQSAFHTQGEIHYLHYYNMDGTFVTEPIDYSHGHILRTPDHDDRVKDPYRPISLVVDLIKKA